jgi:hypothetical protein
MVKRRGRGVAWTRPLTTRTAQLFRCLCKDAGPCVTPVEPRRSGETTCDRRRP